METYIKKTTSELRILDEIDEELCELIDEKLDSEYCTRIFDAIGAATLDGKDAADYKKAVINLAKAVALFLNIGVNKASRPMTNETAGCVFYKFLDIFCFTFDHPMDEEKSDESEEK